MSVPKPRLVLEDVVPRLNAARREVEDSKAAYDDALARRDRLVVHAIDQGTSGRAVAEAAGVKPSRIVAIVAAHDPEPEPARG